MDPPSATNTILGLTTATHFYWFSVGTLGKPHIWQPVIAVVIILAIPCDTVADSSCMAQFWVLIICCTFPRMVLPHHICQISATSCIPLHPLSYSSSWSCLESIAQGFLNLTFWVTVGCSGIACKQKLPVYAYVLNLYK